MDLFQLGQPRAAASEDSDTRWQLPKSYSSVGSVTVFGTPGTRYSVIVISRLSESLEILCRDEGWYLTGSEGAAVSFRMEWALDAGSSGSVVLCGRETPGAFVTPA